MSTVAAKQPPSAGNAHNLFRQKSHNSQIESLLDEISAYNPALAGEDDAMLWDIPEFGGNMGESADGGGYTQEQSGLIKGFGRAFSAGGNVGRTMSAERKTQTAPPAYTAGAPEPSKSNGGSWPEGVGPCAVCGLVAAEISCHECRHNTCAFCDFQVHKSMPVSHTARVSLRPANGTGGQPEYSKVMAMTNKNGKRPAAVARPAPAAFGRTISAELSGGASLDDAILDFFKTDEFSEVLYKASSEMDSLPGATPAEEDVDMFGSADFTGLPLMDFQKPAKMARTTTRVKSQGQQKLKADLKSPRGAAVAKARPAATRAVPSSEPTPAVTLAATPRPLNFKFQLDPTVANAAGYRSVRKAALERFHRKREAQKLNPTVRYKSRKKIADNRPRIKGRFVKTDELVRAT